MSNISIKGIQVKARVEYVHPNIIYVTQFEEMTVDTAEGNSIITKKDLEEYLAKRGT